MNVIHKYPLHIRQEQCIPMPRGAKTLTVQLQGGLPHVWAMIDTSNEMVERKFFVVATGREILTPWLMRYVGTVQADGGYVWHVFEDREDMTRIAP